MQRVEVKWVLPAAMAAVSMAAVAATWYHARLVDIFLDSTTSMLASGGVFLIVARLLLGSLRRVQRLAWQGALAVLGLVALAELGEPFSAAAEQRLGIDNLDDLILLAVAPVALWFFGRFGDVPALPCRWIIAGFVLQAAAMALDFFDDGSGNAYILIANATDLAQALSMMCYLAAVGSVVLDIRHRQMTENSTHAAYVSDSHWTIRDGLYPPPFIFGRRVPPLDTAAGRVHRICNSVLWSSRDLIGWAMNLALIATWPFVAAARSIKAIRSLGGVVQNATGKTKAEQFLEQMSLAFHHRIPPIYYYVYEIHRNGRRWPVGHYLMRHETKEIAFRLLYPRATKFSTPTPLKNKLEFAHKCTTHGLPHAETIMAFSNGKAVSGPEYCDHLPMKDVFVKPALGKGGIGCQRWNAVFGTFRNMAGDYLTEAELLTQVAQLSESEPYLIQHVLKNHSAISDLSVGALCTVRILTFRNEKGGFEVTNAVLRMAVDRYSSVDNFYAGGIAANVDIKTGRLGYATDIGRRFDSEWHEEHPLTDAQIEGRQLPMWQQTMDLAVLAHRTFSDYALIGWDIAILESGPCLVDGNRGPDVDILQRTADRPIGNGRFGELLAFNLERE